MSWLILKSSWKQKSVSNKLVRFNTLTPGKLLYLH